MSATKHILAPNTPYATPYYVINGHRPGPVFMVVSGIHGNEPASIRAAQALAGKFRRRELVLAGGRLIIVPLVNQRAYRQKSRGVPDLNRTFPHVSASRAGHPLSAALFRLARQHRPTWYLDLHEANGLSQLNRKRVGQTLLVSQGTSAAAAARQIINKMNRKVGITAHRFNIKHRERSGTSRMAVQQLLGARAVTVETCWSLDFALRVKYQQQIVSHFLKRAGMIG
ncbi:succinylglutamate desuccinylase/aspartoacylase family protein [Paenibacillus sp. FSL R7-0331]|uniref:succinylglutamate desuccinylase/aspartoacylase family protein n=1 Tax=Paenibacillus sp. FSL R7-0331 TaxID=1536773 RepID=UPI0004F841B6|nr:succinylglutamate desuccinylase/aspartoacylase family protein [Paenibacillus sp. FSL R7-0331]AIQ52960.1 deacylase [Paenibacillus sp. FSL R7-0331]